MDEIQTPKPVKETASLAMKEESAIKIVKSASTVRDLAVTLINELTRVNIRVNPKERTFPYVEISDFGECDTSFKDVALTEAKLHCYVKRDYKGIEKARLFSRNVLDVIAGEHDVGDYRVKIQYTANLEHNEGDAAYVTLILAVTRVSKLK